MPESQRHSRWSLQASFSQTYLRNAYNNGFLCIEVPALVKRLREEFATRDQGKEKTIIPGENGDRFHVRPSAWRGHSFAFPRWDVPQSLVIAGGAENMVAQETGI